MIIFICRNYEQRIFLDIIIYIATISIDVCGNITSNRISTTKKIFKFIIVEIRIGDRWKSFAYPDTIII